MNKIYSFFKKPQVWGSIVAVIVMAVVSLAFFYPDNFDGRSLSQPDMQQGFANGQEASAYEAATGEKALWTNALFSGMPTFQITPSYPSNALFSWINTVYGLALPAPSNLLFMMMVGFFILCLTMRMRWYYGLIGALAWGFSTYFVIIIGAGHIWKFIALSYVPPTIAGFLLLYRGRYLWGTALTALFAMMQLEANHPQMTYYFGLLMGIMAICYLIDAIRRGKIVKWLAATGLALLAGALAVGANSPSLYLTYEYAKETKRAQSELTPLVNNSVADADVDAPRPTGGMPYDQIVGWSYGRSEMFSLIVPNIKGGGSARPEGGKMVPLSLAQLENAAAYSDAPIVQYLSQYFNDSEGTNGPVYVGAFIFALFLAGCFIVRGPLKWALVAGTIMSVLLALGRNAETITDLMIYNFPMYNKFRAVESILVVAEFTIPFLAVLALRDIFDHPEEARKNVRKLSWSGLVVAAVCVMALIAPKTFGDVITSADQGTVDAIQGQIAQMGQQQGASEQQISQMAYQYSLANPATRTAVEALRLGMVRNDALRSLCILLAGAGIVLLLLKGKMNRGTAVAAVAVLVLIDLYPVDKRYVSHSSFTDSAPGGFITFTPDKIDQQILADTTTHYRVFDGPGFNSPDRSYFHSMLGGYHAAKLNRYEDVIQRRLMYAVQYGYMPDAPELDLPQYAELAKKLRASYAVMDLLNAKYVITGDPREPLVVNPYAMGNAWMADSLVWVDGADAEMEMLDPARVDLRRVAVADRRFAEALPAQPEASANDTIFLTSYTPNTLTYSATVAKDNAVAVFSEVYFPWGWKATVDGKEVALARVDYLLRALALPAGHHTVEMSFAPASLTVTANVAYACVTLIYLLLVGAILLPIRKWQS